MNEKIRRYDIDWIRVIVFDILIVFHVGMFFNTWDWHLKNNELVDWFKYPMIFTSEWRIPILFVVSGIGTKFALSRKSGREYISERLTRLFFPLTVGIFVTVLPQVYLERLVDGRFEGNMFEFIPHFFQGVYPSGNLSWHHLWFLPYLLVMSLLATPLFLKLRKKENALINLLRRVFEQSAWGVYLFVVPLTLIETHLHPYFPTTHAFVGDWYALTFYFFLFISGFILVSLGDTFWKSVNQLRWFALIIGIFAFSLLMSIDQLTLKSYRIYEFIKILNMWSWIIAIFGFAGQYLNKESSIIKVRNEAVYPFYIFHQVITITIGFYLMTSPLSIHWKFIIMVAGTFSGAWILTEIVKKIKPLRPLFGLKNR